MSYPKRYIYAHSLNPPHLNSLHLELFNTIHQPLLILLLITLAHQALLPKLSPRQLDRLLNLRLLQLRQPLLLLTHPLLLHLPQEPLAPFEESLRRDGRAVELLILLPLSSELLLLNHLCGGVFTVLDELFCGFFQGGVQREDHGHAEVLLDGVLQVGEQLVAVVADAEVQVGRAVVGGEDVEVRRLVGVFVGVAHGEEEVGGFFVFGGFFVGDVEDDFYPELCLGDV